MTRTENVHGCPVAGGRTLGLDASPGDSLDARRVLFVVDEPSVNDHRVSSHEIGHILGLHHELFDETRLMYSGTNGEMLTDTEQAIARYGAQGIVEGVR